MAVTDNPAIAQPRPEAQPLEIKEVTSGRLKTWDVTASDDSDGRGRRAFFSEGKLNQVSGKLRQPRKAKWGGARNSKTRRSLSLTIGQVRGIQSAVSHSLLIGLPLNRHITLQFGLMGLGDEQAMDALSVYLKQARDWTSRQGGQTSFVWVRELSSAGAHAHVLVHVPPALERMYLVKHRYWLMNACKRPYAKGAVCTRKIYGWESARRGQVETYLINLENVTAYLVKGANADAVNALNLNRKKPGGTIIGKRCGFSQNLGLGARHSSRRARHVE